MEKLLRESTFEADLRELVLYEHHLVDMVNKFVKKYPNYNKLMIGIRNDKND